jgi:hypothetical protein
LSQLEAVISTTAAMDIATVHVLGGPAAVHGLPGYARIGIRHPSHVSVSFSLYTQSAMTSRAMTITAAVNSQ